ncbi:MAG TPA: glycosyltransferase family A protein [Candidatus Thiothrix moscowensis]|uniref:glycosyltransferase family 2 protein n=1 Tax=unclassified Thiothrix TaxID=2636184 RepID=UPI0025F14118|nr:MULTISPECIES: glycosyltransferase family A protein [unclassified Thiothrix]HRJ54150.1 glycosyltransferase family A protein [Candidatus Thiothrix moscowensis]HRJ94358.1 glycosyltransferase family A protein [Candidatus Thiothrix moscowensis]
MNLHPLISVILPVYNGEVWLKDAIQCVLDQTFQDFELIIINDGSTDKSWDTICSFTDIRIKAYHQNNIGLAATLNRGINLSQGSFIARQDQDDWMHPERLAKQISFLNKHSDYAGVGTWAEIRQDNNPTKRYHHHPTENKTLQLILLFDNPFVHSSMLLRRAPLIQLGGYCIDPARQPPEDYELWSRLAKQYNIANLDSVLTAYREVAGSMSRTSNNPFQEKVIRISAENIHYLLSEQYTLEQSMLLSKLYHGVSTPSTQLSMKTAISMFAQAAYKISDSPTAWSSEFNCNYQRILSHIKKQAIRKMIPAPILNLLRRLKQN